MCKELLELKGTLENCLDLIVEYLNKPTYKNYVKAQKELNKKPICRLNWLFNKTAVNNSMRTCIISVQDELNFYDKKLEKILKK